MQIVDSILSINYVPTHRTHPGFVIYDILVKMPSQAHSLYVHKDPLVPSHLCFFLIHILLQSKTQSSPNFSSIQHPIPSPIPPSRMQLRPLPAALLAATAFSLLTIQSQTSTHNPTTSTYCVPVPRRHNSAKILPRMRRPDPNEMSLSPPSLTGPSTNVTKDTSPSSNPLQALPPPSNWVLTLEDLITAVFRIVITILTLFNVNITWRIRGECHRMCWAHIHLSSQLTSPNSQSRSSTSQIGACMGWCEVGDCLSRGIAALRCLDWLG